MEIQERGYWVFGIRYSLWSCRRGSKSRGRSKPEVKRWMPAAVCVRHHYISKA